jgi:hypothetical protein
VEEIAKAPPHKSKKKMKRKDEVCIRKALAYERTPSFVTQGKGEIKPSVGLSVKPPMAPKKNKGKEKALEPREEWIHFVQTLLKEPSWEWWMSHKHEKPNLLETLKCKEFKL